jgi:hypothetical protein
MFAKQTKNQVQQVQPTQPTQPVNQFYFSSLESSGLVSTEASDTSNKTSTEYIILQNDFLHSRVKELDVL